MTRSLFPALCVLLLTACPPSGNGNHSDGGTSGGDDGGTQSPYSLQVIDSTPTSRVPMAAAVLPNDRVGIAYYVPTGQVDANNVPYYDLRYREWSASGLTPPVTIDTVQRFVGLTVAAQPNGEPAIGFLGGHDTTQSYWFQNDAYIAYRSTAGNWTSEVVVQTSGEAPSSSPVSTAGFLVGLHPALAFDGPTAFLAYRDCHNGQFGQQDFNGSDLEVANGWASNWTKVVAIGADGTTVGKQGYGGHNQLLVVNHVAHLVFDRIISVDEGSGTDVLYMKRDPSSGAWSTPKVILSTPSDMIGPSFAYDPSAGFGVAAVNRTANLLNYVSSTDGTSWTVPDPVWQSGTGGWWPSVGFDPSTHEPEVVYYYCDNRTGIDEGSCRESDDELRIASRIDSWTPRTVDPAGGYAPKLLYLSTGKRVIVYRDVTTSGATKGIVKIAVEQ